VNADRWKQIEDCYHAAMERPAHERDAFLAQSYAADPELRREVESLLDHEGTADELLESPAWNHVTPSDETGTFAPGALLAGSMMAEYRIAGKLGSGGMGEVYRATDTKLQRQVALKVLASELAQNDTWKSRFQREARVLASLNHPHIAAIYGLEESGGVSAIAMELVEGPTLAECMERGRIPVPEALAIARQIAEALEYAHEKGIVHRDLKPANVKLRPDGVVKVLDFGLAKDVNPREAPTATATGAGGIMGTPAYMAPEQAAGLQVDRRADIWAFGVVLFEMLAGHQAYARKTTLETLAAVARDDPPWDKLPAETPAQIRGLLRRCLDRDTRNRLRDVGEARIAIQNTGKEPEVTVGAVATRSPSGASTPRQKYLRLAVSVTVVLLLTLSGWWFAKLHKVPALELKLRQLTTNSMENPVESAAISPDGKYLAYTDFLGMHIRSIDSGETRTVPQPEGLHGERCCVVDFWFPDSTRFVVDSGDPGPILNMWVVSMVGGAPRVLREDGEPWDISPDGGTIAFTRNFGRVDHREIWLMDADGRNPRQFWAVDEESGLQYVHWSPDGRRLAYVTFHLTADRFEITLDSRDRDGRNPANIWSETAANEEIARFSDYIWLADGRMILFLNEGDTGGLSSLTTKRNLWMTRLDPRTGKRQQEWTKITDWPAGSSLENATATHDGRIAFRKVIGQSAVYVAELEAGGKKLKEPPRRLTLEEGRNHPSAWTADNQAVILESNRSGHLGIYRQVPGQDTAEAIVAGPENAWAPVVSPDGHWILYLAYPGVRGFDTPVQLMRVPITGGPSQKIDTKVMYGTPRCAVGPPGLCAIAEPAAGRKQMVFTAFDPVAGRGRELTPPMEVDPKADYLWDLSPDGRRIAVVKISHPYSFEESQISEGPIHILSLDGQPPLELRAKGRKNQWQSLDWAADGNGLYVSAWAAAGSVLLYLDLKGNASDVWPHPSMDRGTRGIPSRNGRRIALLGRNQDSNVWMIEKF
jgi:eukaryotic-like serine/threonine-protein kinase